MSARVVFKYALLDTDGIRIKLPLTSKPVLFAEQRGVLHVWIDQPVGPSPMGTHEFLIRGTGHEYDAPGWRHIASTLVDGGNFVFHLYGRVA